MDTIEKGTKGLIDDRSKALPVAIVTDYFVNMITYTQSTKDIVNTVAGDIKTLVKDTIISYQESQVLPISLTIFTSIFIPLILYLTFKATLSMLT